MSWRAAREASSTGANTEPLRALNPVLLRARQMHGEDDSSGGGEASARSSSSSYDHPRSSSYDHPRSSSYDQQRSSSSYDQQRPSSSYDQQRPSAYDYPQHGAAASSAKYFSAMPPPPQYPGQSYPYSYSFQPPPPPQSQPPPPAAAPTPIEYGPDGEPIKKKRKRWGDESDKTETMVTVLPSTMTPEQQKSYLCTFVLSRVF
jgi:hypothetical protein